MEHLSTMRERQGGRSGARRGARGVRALPTKTDILHQPRHFGFFAAAFHPKLGKSMFDPVGDTSSQKRVSGAQRHPPPPLGLSKAHIPARPTTPEFGVGRRLTQIHADRERKSPSSGKASVLGGRAGSPLPAARRYRTMVPLPMPDGGHAPSPRLRRTGRSARPTFPVPPKTDALLHLRPSVDSMSPGPLSRCTSTAAAMVFTVKPDNFLHSGCIEPERSRGS